MVIVAGNQFMHYITLDEALKKGEGFFQPFNVKTVDDMRNVKMEDLLKRAIELGQIKKGFLFSPVIDGNPSQKVSMILWMKTLSAQMMSLLDTIQKTCSLM